MTWKDLALLTCTAIGSGASRPGAALGKGEAVRLPPLYLDVAAAPMLGDLPVHELLAEAATWRLAGLIFTVRSTADGQLAVWPADVTPWMTNCPLDCGQLLAEELAFIDLDATRAGTQPPALFAEVVESARQLGVQVLSQTAVDHETASAGARAPVAALIDLARRGIGPQTPCIGLLPVEDGRWSDPVRTWQDLLFLPEPAAPWRVADPTAILLLAGASPADPPPPPLGITSLAPNAASSRVAAALPAWVTSCRSARAFRGADPDGADHRIAELIGLGSRRTAEETAELRLWLRVLLPPDPAARVPESALVKAASDPDLVVQAWSLAILARVAPDAVAAQLQVHISNLGGADAATGPLLVWAAGQAGRPELFAPIAQFVGQTAAPPRTPGTSPAPDVAHPTLLAAALGALGRLAAPGGARMVEEWIVDVPPPYQAAAAWCLGSHLPEEDARRALDQILDTTPPNRAAKLAAVRALARVGSNAEIRRLCALLAHPDRGVREMAFTFLTRLAPERLAEPLALTLAGASFLPESAAMAALLCGIRGDAALLPAVETALRKAPAGGAQALAALLGWAQARIKREPVPAGTLGDPAALASGQAMHRQLAASLFTARSEAPCLSGSDALPWPEGLAPIGMNLRNPLASTLDLVLQIQVPEGEPWQVIPRERRIALAPGMEEEVIFRLRPAQAGSCTVPRLLLRYGPGDETVREWPLPLPSRCPWSELTPAPPDTSSNQPDRPARDAPLSMDMAVRLTSDTGGEAEITVRVAGAGSGTAGAFLLALGDRHAAWPDLWVQTVATDGTSVGVPAPIGTTAGRLQIVAAETRPEADGLAGRFRLTASSPDTLSDGFFADCAYIELAPTRSTPGTRAIGIWGALLPYPPAPACLLPSWGARP